MENFKKGTEIKLKDGKRVTVVKLLGKGGQGVVYEVVSEGRRYALKWYLREYLKHINQKKFYDNLSENQKEGAPSPDFLWPVSVSEYKENSFGYLMNLRPDGYSDFSSFLNAKVRFRSVRVQIAAAKNICRAFQALHRSGYSYQDINNGNFFINANNGKVLICDNDNVSPCGTWMGMAGKDRYMAPEIVLGKKHAGMESDLYSLSVILFMIFFIAHPLEGRAVHACPCLTPRYMRYFYAENPVFIYDPVNATNRPVKGIDNNVINLWACYPKILRELFIRAFTKGILREGYRVRENEWIDCFDEIKRNLLVCPRCGGEQFYNHIDDGGSEFLCEDCKRKIRKPFIMQHNRDRMLLYLGTKIRRSDLSGTEDNTVVGEVIESGKHPGLWGIKMNGSVSWEATYSNGKTVSGDGGKVMPLFADTDYKINNESIKISI